MIFMKVHEDENGFISSFIYESLELFAKGQIISKAKCQAVDSPKKRTNGI